MPLKVYFMGIGGVGMGALAGLFKEAGAEVCGSEGSPVYPPMSNLLEEISVRVHIGYQPENLEEEEPDFVVIGNVIRRDNPEMLYVLEKKYPYLSFPEALYGYFIRGRKSLVVAGTHGKTTTSALLGYALERLREDPIFLVGGLLKDRGRNFRYGKGNFIVLEGDEYDTAFFDKRPKFVHYAPYGAILTSVEFDHADIYPNFEVLKDSFSAFLELLPENGVLLYFADDPEVKTLAQEFSGRKVAYGRKGELKFLKKERVKGSWGQEVYYSLEGEEDSFFLPLIGEHNALNALAVLGLLRELGFTLAEIKQALASFPGVKRRQEILLKEPVLIIDDFAHHPTAVKVTLEAVREALPERRLVACFEPRTNTSRRNVFQEDYVSALARAEMVFLKTPPQLEKVPEKERIDLKYIARKLKERGLQAWAFDRSEDMFLRLKGHLRPGDVVIFMSNGPFDHLPNRLAKDLGAQF